MSLWKNPPTPDNPAMVVICHQFDDTALEEYFSVRPGLIPVTVYPENGRWVLKSRLDALSDYRDYKQLLEALFDRTGARRMIKMTGYRPDYAHHVLDGMIDELVEADDTPYRVLTTELMYACHLVIDCFDRQVLDDLIPPYVQVNTRLNVDKEESFFQIIPSNELFREYYEGGGIPDLRAVPPNLNVNIVNTCNTHCTKCSMWTEQYQERYPSDGTVMPVDMLQKIIDEMSSHWDQWSITFSDRGEPTMHPQLVEFCTNVRKAGGDLYLNSNATQLDPEKADAILNLRPASFLFNVDSIVPETYKKLYQYDACERVVSNVNHLLASRREMDNPPQATMHFSDLPESQGEFEAYKEYWMERGADVWWACQADKFSTHGNIRHKPLYDVRRRIPCTYLRHILGVRVDGTVLNCTQAAYYHEPLGNVKEKTLEECWTSSFVHYMRDTQENFQTNQICQNCHNPYSHLWGFTRTEGGIMEQRTPNYIFHKHVST